jgi:hypothetical protein
LTYRNRLVLISAEGLGRTVDFMVNGSWFHDIIDVMRHATYRPINSFNCPTFVIGRKLPVT